MSPANATQVTLRNITKKYGNKTVLNNLNLTLGAGEMLALLGPSGCGKSTTLKILAGLENACAGEVLVNGQDISGIPVRARNMGIVFQAYSLFPHLSAQENVAYGLKVRRSAKKDRMRRAAELLDLVGLSEHLHKLPAQLSGGQQQRVALARALAIEPAVLLLDEPLSALDAKVRTQLRQEIRHLQLTSGITTLMVTHDQEEAITMADRVGVMCAGQISQIGSPYELYHNPQNPFVSQFIGSVNRILGKTTGSKINVLGKDLTIVNWQDPNAAAQQACALIRPADLQVRLLPEQTNSRNKHTVAAKQLHGAFTAVYIDTACGNRVRVDLPLAQARELPLGACVDLQILRNDTVIDALTPQEAASFNPQIRINA